MVKLLSVEKFHEGIRIEMICGKRVMDYLNMVNDQNHQISVNFPQKWIRLRRQWNVFRMRISV